MHDLRLDSGDGLEQRMYHQQVGRISKPGHVEPAQVNLFLDCFGMNGQGFIGQQQDYLAQSGQSIGQLDCVGEEPKVYKHDVHVSPPSCREPGLLG